MKVDYIQECSCGAITVILPNGISNSMARETFDSIGFEGEWAESKFCHCNHCVNGWGIDLCECGLGEPVGECNCGRTTPSEKLGVPRPFLGFVSNPLNCSIWEL